MFAAELFIGKREVTTEEVQLWIKHLKPVWRGNWDWMKQALVLWDEEMKRRGLSDQQISMDDFVRGPDE